MGPNPFVGIVLHWIGGFFAATTFVPFRRIRGWSWEVYWLVQGIAAWVIAPLCLTLLLVPHALNILRAAPTSALIYAFAWGALWGIGGLTFGLAVRYLGIALGYAIALGLSTVFGTLIPPLYAGTLRGMWQQDAGRIVLAGLAVCVCAVAVSGIAGILKEYERDTTQRIAAGEGDYSFLKGIAVASLAGVMSSCFAFGLKAGEPFAALAKTRLLASGAADLWQNLPVVMVVLWGGFATNLVWTIALLIRNRTFPEYMGYSNHVSLELPRSNPRVGLKRLAPSTLLRNYLFATAVGVIWYFQFFFYSMGQSRMGRYDFSSWALHMASIIIFATVWGVLLREWRGTSVRTRLLVSFGLILLVLSTLIIGYGNYVQSSTDPLVR